MVLDLPPDAPLDDVTARLRELHEAYRDGVRAPTTTATRTPDSPPMRGADPAIVLVPGVGMFSLRREQADRPRRRRVLRQRDQRDARRRGALDLRADPRGGEVPRSSTGRWRRPSSPACPSPGRSPARVAFVTGGGSGHRPGHRPPARGRGRLRGRRRHRRGQRRRRSPRELGGPDVAIGVDGRRHRRGAGRARRSRPAVLAFGGVDLVVNNAGLSISKPLLETTVADWDLQHDVMARGSFLVVARGGAGHDRAGRWAATSSTSSARTRSSPARTTSRTARRRPTRPTRSGCWPPSSASTASASTASTPTASSAARGSSPRAGAPTGPRTYGIPEDKLGEFYAQRTLLKREVLPEHVAAAVFALTGGDLQPDDRACTSRSMRVSRPHSCADDPVTGDDRSTRRGRGLGASAVG